MHGFYDQPEDYVIGPTYGVVPPCRFRIHGPIRRVSMSFTSLARCVGFEYVIAMTSTNPVPGTYAMPTGFEPAISAVTGRCFKPAKLWHQDSTFIFTSMARHAGLERGGTGNRTRLRTVSASGFPARRTKLPPDVRPESNRRFPLSTDGGTTPPSHAHHCIHDPMQGVCGDEGSRTPCLRFARAAL